MCGEHLIRRTYRRGIVGSSPHVRGAPPGDPGAAELLGDHPRMCGEHPLSLMWPVAFWGSSPHVRGAPGCQAPGSRSEGIIPACAGSTSCCRSLTSPRWDHPRMCGEHFITGFHPVTASGSSPHVRGAPPVTPEYPYAGRDHPRMCGEHRRGMKVSQSLAGSSPHVRGARGANRRPPCRDGIIPACAGSTLKYLAFLGYSSAFSFGSQGSKLFTCVVSYPPNFRAL